MAKCDICGKGVTFGIKVSHSHRRSNRTWKPNVRKVRAVVNGNTKSVNVCTRCLRSGKVTRAVWFLNIRDCKKVPVVRRAENYPFLRNVFFAKSWTSNENYRPVFTGGNSGFAAVFFRLRFSFFYSLFFSCKFFQNYFAFFTNVCYNDTEDIKSDVFWQYITINNRSV